MIASVIRSHTFLPAPLPPPSLFHVCRSAILLEPRTWTNPWISGPPWIPVDSAIPLSSDRLGPMNLADSQSPPNLRILAIFPYPPPFVFPCPSLAPSFSPFTINVLSEEFDRTGRSTVPTRHAFPRCVVVVAVARGRSETAPKENSYRRTCRRCETMRRDEGFYRCHLAISIMIRWGARVASDAPPVTRTSLSLRNTVLITWMMPLVHSTSGRMTRILLPSHSTW